MLPILTQLKKGDFHLFDLFRPHLASKLVKRANSVRTKKNIWWQKTQDNADLKSGEEVEKMFTQKKFVLFSEF
jgi:hypothetical protein